MLEEHDWNLAQAIETRGRLREEIEICLSECVSEEKDCPKELENS